MVTSGPTRRSVRIRPTAKQVMSRCRLLVLATVWTLIAAPAAAQQPGTGTIRGRVLDAQKQGVPAHVRMIQSQTGLARETLADPVGRFTITNVVPGEVELSVQAPGFAARQLKGLVIEVGGVLDLEIALQISSLQEEITVAGTAGAVDIVGSDIGTVISAREIASASPERPQLPRAGVPGAR